MHLRRTDLRALHTRPSDPETDQTSRQSAHDREACRNSRRERQGRGARLVERRLEESILAHLVSLRPPSWRSLVAAVALLTASGAGAHGQKLDVIFVGTPPNVVNEMLTLAHVARGDVVYDLGSGDGRIVISAVKDFGADRGVGIDLDPARTAEAIENARRAGVGDRVTFVTRDLFQSDFSEATVVAVYLLPEMLQRLLPKLRALRPGTRIVSHNYDMGSAWPPDDSLLVEDSFVYLWVVH
jgi:hypothetical protein